jgi:hypothetical protein
MEGKEKQMTTFRQVYEKYCDRFIEYLKTNKDSNNDKVILSENTQSIGDITNSIVIGVNVNRSEVVYNNNIEEMIELQKGYQELLKTKDNHITELLTIVKKLTD